MIQLNLLAVLLLLAVIARYIVFNAYEPFMIFFIILLPILSLIVYILSKRFAKKELTFKPKEIEGWSFYNLQKSLQVKKPLFKGEQQRGYVKRYFSRKWQYVVGDIIGFNWYLSLEIQIDRDTYDVQWYREKWFIQQEHWKIYKNGAQIGKAHTVFNLKNTAKIKEQLEFTFSDKTYTTSAKTVTSTITLAQEEMKIGTLKRNHLLSNTKVIDLQEDLPENVIALIMHAHYFKH